MKGAKASSIHGAGGGPISWTNRERTEPHAIHVQVLQHPVVQPNRKAPDWWREPNRSTSEASIWFTSHSRVIVMEPPVVIVIAVGVRHIQYHAQSRTGWRFGKIVTKRNGPTAPVTPPAARRLRQDVLVLSRKTIAIARCKAHCSAGATPVCNRRIARGRRSGRQHCTLGSTRARRRCRTTFQIANRRRKLR